MLRTFSHCGVVRYTTGESAHSKMTGFDLKRRVAPNYFLSKICCKNKVVSRKNR